MQNTIRMLTPADLKVFTSVLMHFLGMNHGVYKHQLNYEHSDYLWLSFDIKLIALLPLLSRTYHSDERRKIYVY